MVESRPMSAAPEAAYRLEAYQVCPDSRQLEHDFLCMAASLEALSDDPLAAEIVQIARINNILPVSVTAFQRMPGQGLGGVLKLPSESQPRAMILGSRA